MIKIFEIPPMVDDEVGRFERTFQRRLNNLCYGKGNGKWMPIIAITDSELVENELKEFTNVVKQISSLPEFGYHYVGNQTLFDSLEF